MRAADLLILIPLLGCTSNRPPLRDLARIADTAAVAIVESDRAIFVFPTETRNAFLWPQNSLDPEANKFAWGITIIAGDTSFLPGVQAYRGVHPAPLSSLADVVRAGPAQLLYNPGGHIQMLDQTTRVSARVSNGRVVVTVNGAAQIQRIFRDSPPTMCWVPMTIVARRCRKFVSRSRMLPEGRSSSIAFETSTIFPRPDLRTCSASWRLRRNG